jgi:CheY-like chemotaxis protein
VVEHLGVEADTPGAISSSLANDHNENSREKTNTIEKERQQKPKAKILLIDDEPDIVDILARWLSSKNLQVDSFTKSPEALAHWIQHSEEYCLVLSDIRMPGVTGFQIARRIKEVNPKVKIVLFSAFEINTQEFEKVLPSTHVDEFIAKPISMEKLLRIVQKQIGDLKSLPVQLGTGK